jgi:hypothetical protein
MSREYILCSAIYFNDGKNHIHQPKNIDEGFVVCGRRHHNCFATFKAMGSTKPERIERMDEVQGFLTNLDRFVDRVEGGKIAFNAGQTTELKDRLFSEDLY